MQKMEQILQVLESGVQCYFLIFAGLLNEVI